MKIGELKSLLRLIESVPDNGEATFKVGYHDGTIRLVLKWNGAGGVTEMEIKVPRSRNR